MKNVRIWFEKQGAARYISHLDLTRNMARGLKLSGLPVWYTEGFNPRIYMTYAMPLSLGVCGERECMDIRLTEEISLEEVAPRLNAHLPSGLRTLEATEPVNKFEDIQYGEYHLFLEGDPETLEEQLHTLFQKEEVLVRKHTKKGDKEFDIKPGFQNAQVDRQEEGLLLHLCLPCSVNGSTNPGLLLEALKRHEGLEPYGVITRKRLLLQDFSELR